MSDLMKFWRSLTGGQKSTFIDELIKEKELYDKFVRAGFTTTTGEVSDRAKERMGILNLVEKINLVDLITEITTIGTLDLLKSITSIDLIKDITSVDTLDLLKSITSVDLIKSITSIDLVKSITSIDLLKSITSVDLIKDITSVDLIDTITTLGTVNLIKSITSVDLITSITTLGTLNLVKDITSVDLIDTITALGTVDLIKSITSIDLVKTITSIGSLDLLKSVTSIDLVKAITDVGTVNLINTLTTLGTVNLVKSITTIDLVTSITNLGTLNLINSITTIGTVNLIKDITSVDLIDSITTLGTVNLIKDITSIDLIDAITQVNLIKSITSIDLLKSITSIDLVKSITSIDLLKEITTIGTITNPIKVITAGADNIFIDLLKVGAYTERRSTLSNNGASPSWDYSPDTNFYMGKFFPRGTRGWIDTIEVYCKDNGAAGGTITVYVAPYIGAGKLASATITVPAGGAAAWRSVSFRRMWNYDSMFIFIVGSTTDMRYAYDSGIIDQFYSSDAGVTWVAYNYRSWIRVLLKAETVGDIPVSGTVNTVEIPSLSSTRQDIGLGVNAGSEAYDTLQAGSGELLIAIFYAADDARTYLRPRIKCDGVQVMPIDSSFINWHDYYIGSEGAGSGIQLSKWDAPAGRAALMVVIPYPFKRSLEIGFYNWGGIAYNGSIGYSYKKIS